MSESADFRSWAARVARQATKEPDTCEAQRLRSIAGYWERLADVEDWRSDGDLPASETIAPEGGKQLGEGIAPLVWPIGLKKH